MNRRVVAWLSATLCLVVSCSTKPNDAALKVTVNFTSKSRAQCVRVVAQGAGPERLTEPIVRGTKTSLTVAVFRAEDLTGEITVRARGFVGSDCAEASYNESSSTESTTLSVTSPGVQEITLTLDGPLAANDQDGDGFSTTLDCNDLDSAVNPGRLEVCGNGKDDDCAHGVDCADTSCNGQACDDANDCTSNDSCQSGTCTGAAKVCNMPGLCEQPSGSCTAGACGYAANTGGTCDGGVCRSDKSCAPPNTEVLCDDGLDNDTDNLSDCADPDCNLQACDAGTHCFNTVQCVSGSCQTSSPVVCTAPAGGCFDAGSCIPSSGACSTSLAPSGTTCSAGSCRSDGGCGPTEAVGQCSNGIDDDDDGEADCLDDSCLGQVCSDSNACTLGETCMPGLVCTNATSNLMCTMPPSECHVSGGCAPDSGCLYFYQTGRVCDGGTCQSDGGCGTPFGYLASNFDPNTLTTPTSDVVINCATAEFNTDFAPFDGGFLGWCDGGIWAASVKQQDSGTNVVVVSVRSLFITDAGAINFTGSRPVIVEVFGDAVIEGTVTARANGVRMAAGGASATGCGSGVGGTGTNSGQSTGGGGGAAFGSVGGAGGNSLGQTNAGAAGQVNGAAELVPLRGGCRGGPGGPGVGAAVGGAGGGALQISVAGTLTIKGRIAAPGMGGAGGNGTADLNAGGAGAGSGGGILLEATDLEVHASALITAQGGGGGQGDNIPSAGGGLGVSGEAGSYVSLNAASGGITADGGHGGNGGSGAAGASVAGDGVNGIGGGSENGGGGGGGAGLGRIRINVQGSCRTDGGTFSPAPSRNAGTCP